MTPEQAAWVREHAWPTRRRDNYAHAAAHPELAAEDYGCVCLLGRPCYWCETGRHHECRGTGPKVSATFLLESDGLSTFRTPDHRVVNVWLGDRTCRAMCSCHCRRSAHERGLLFDLTTA